MRKIALLLTLCLLLGLTACVSAPVAPATTEAPKTEAPATTEAPKTEAPATTEAPTTEAPVTTEAHETDAPATEAPTSEEIRGTITDSAYENEALNLRIARPEGWTFYDDDQIAQVNNVTAEIMAGTDVAELIGKNGQFMDMMMANLSGNNLNLILQPKQAVLDAYSDEQIFTLSEATYKAQFSAAGMETKVYEPVTMKVGGEDRTVLHLVMVSNGIEINEYQIWYRTDADYMGVLTVGLTDGSDVQPILDGITGLN